MHGAHPQEFVILKRQLLLAPRQVRVRMLERIEGLLAEIEPSRTYPFDYISYRIMDHRPVELTDISFSYDEVERELAALVEEVGGTVSVRADSVEEPVLTVDDLAARWRVSTVTVMRWRREGLGGRLFRFGAGRRIGVRASLAERFEARHRDLIRRSRASRKLTEEERRALIEEALVALAREELPVAILASLADKFGLPQAGIEKMLWSEAQANPALKALSPASISERESRLIYREVEAGASVEEVAAKYGRTGERVRQVHAAGRAGALLKRRIKVIWSSEFADAEAAEHILEAGAPAQRTAEASEADPEELPVYLRGAAGMPLLTREDETGLFRKYNYIKYLAKELREKLDAENPDVTRMDRIEALMAEAEKIRDHIVCSNLRLVMAIAKRHYGKKTSFPALISDGNVALMDAVETFDYARGNRFSTYAGWAIVRRFARTVPEENYRFTTVETEVLDVAAKVEVDYLATKPAVVVAGIARALSGLPERERVVLESRFGLGGREHASTLAEIGALFGVTKERIRQIESQALARLKHIIEADAPELCP